MSNESSTVGIERELRVCEECGLNYLKRCPVKISRNGIARVPKIYACPSCIWTNWSHAKEWKSQIYMNKLTGRHCDECPSYAKCLTLLV
jgi:hypothetical protein